jgi:hypothetical protein
MDGAIVDKIIAHFEGQLFDEKDWGHGLGLITKENVPDPERLQVLSTDLYGSKGRESVGGPCGRMNGANTYSPWAIG